MWRLWYSVFYCHLSFFNDIAPQCRYHRSETHATSGLWHGAAMGFFAKRTYLGRSGYSPNSGLYVGVYRARHVWNLRLSRRHFSRGSSVCYGLNAVFVIRPVAVDLTRGGKEPLNLNPKP